MGKRETELFELDIQDALPEIATTNAVPDMHPWLQNLPAPPTLQQAKAEQDRAEEYEQFLDDILPEFGPNVTEEDHINREIAWQIKKHQERIGIEMCNERRKEIAEGAMLTMAEEESKRSDERWRKGNPWLDHEGRAIGVTERHIEHRHFWGPSDEEIEEILKERDIRWQKEAKEDWDAEIEKEKMERERDDRLKKEADSAALKLFRVNIRRMKGMPKIIKRLDAKFQSEAREALRQQQRQAEMWSCGGHVFTEGICRLCGEKKEQEGDY